MVPTIGLSRTTLSDNGFINAYVSDSTSEYNYSDAICLLFRPTNLGKFRELLDTERERTTALIDDYDYEGGYIVVVYKLKTEFKKDFDLVRQGKYSKTSKEFQKLFPDTVMLNNKEHVSLQYRVFNKAQDLIDYWENELDIKFTNDLEVWRGFDEQSEILDIEKVRDFLEINIK
jgi:hypothetical protein